MFCYDLHGIPASHVPGRKNGTDVRPSHIIKTTALAVVAGRWAFQTRFLRSLNLLLDLWQ